MLLTQEVSGLDRILLIDQLEQILQSLVTGQTINVEFDTEDNGERTLTITATSTLTGITEEDEQLEQEETEEEDNDNDYDNDNDPPEPPAPDPPQDTPGDSFFEGGNNGSFFK